MSIWVKTSDGIINCNNIRTKHYINTNQCFIITYDNNNEIILNNYLDDKTAEFVINDIINHINLGEKVYIMPSQEDIDKIINIKT